MTDFKPGDQVLYEVATRAGRDSFSWPATVIEERGARVLIDLVHWKSGDRVRRAVRPYTLRRVAV